MASLRKVDHVVVAHVVELASISQLIHEFKQLAKKLNQFIIMFK